MMASEAAAASATYGLCHHAALQTRERRASECSSGSENDAGTARDTPDLHALLRACNVLAAAFLMCSILSFNSSAYTCAGSALDALLVMSDVVCIDVSSALFVLAGSALGTLLEESAPAQRTGLARVIAGAILLDLYITTFCALLLGSVHALVLARFRWRDVAFTALEGLTTLRALDFQQSAATPHSYNVAAWPAQSLLWCVLGAQGLQTLDARLAARLPALASAIVCVAALLGIVFFTAFGSMQATSNIFYANACSVKYRSLEFNLGVHAVFLIRRHQPLVAVLRRVSRHAAGSVALLVATVWVTEVGRAVPAPHEGPCLRLYYRNACLQAHHGFLLRGCGLALFLLLHAGTGPAPAPQHLASEMRLSAALFSGVCFCWPVCIAVKLALDITFGSALSNQNRPVVLMITVTGLAALCCSYHALVQPHLLAGVRAAARATALRAPASTRADLLERAELPTPAALEDAGDDALADACDEAARATAAAPPPACAPPPRGSGPRPGPRACAP